MSVPAEAEFEGDSGQGGLCHDVAVEARSGDIASEAVGPLPWLPGYSRGMVQESVKATALGTVQRVLLLEESDWPDLEEGDGLPKKLGFVMSVSTRFKADGLCRRRVHTEWAPSAPGKDPLK